MNIKVRLKNPWFWVGLVSVMLTATGLDPSMFTSWQAVGDAVLAVVSNPFQLGTMALAVLAVFVDPTTDGVGDSTWVLNKGSYSALDDFKKEAK